MTVGLQHTSRSPEFLMPDPNTPQPRRRSWPYAVTAAITLTLQQGWNPQQVITLTTCLLVLIALITSTGHNDQ
jgi:hypothetical protein